MAAGTKYNLNDVYKPQEFYRVESGVRKSGAWKLDVTNLVVGSVLPTFTPVCVDLQKRTVVPVRNIEFQSAATSGSATKVKIKKGSLAYVGMHIGNGSKGATINAIDTKNPAYDELTLAADLGANAKVGDVWFEATAVGGTSKKHTANFVLYAPAKVESDAPVLVDLLMQAYEVKIPKLPLPIHAKDMEGLTSRFQFEY